MWGLAGGNRLLELSLENVSFFPWTLPVLLWASWLSWTKEALPPGSLVIMACRLDTGPEDGATWAFTAPSETMSQNNLFLIAVLSAVLFVTAIAEVTKTHSNNIQHTVLNIHCDKKEIHWIMFFCVLLKKHGWVGWCMTLITAQQADLYVLHSDFQARQGKNLSQKKIALLHFKTLFCISCVCMCNTKKSQSNFQKLVLALSLFFVLSCFVLFWERVSLCSFEACPGFQSVDQAGLELT